MDFYVVDTETTGFNPERNDVIEVAALQVMDTNDNKFLVKKKFQTYVNPQYPLPPEIVEFNRKNQTGITDEVLAKAPYAYQAANMFYDFIGDYPLIVGHNFAKFDAKFIDKLYSRAGLLFNCRIIDTLNLSRELIPNGSHKLGDLFEKTAKRHSGDTPKFHSALADCYATLDLLEYLSELKRVSMK